MGRNMFLRRLDLPADGPTLVATKARLDCALDLVEAGLGEADFLAGQEFSAADIMTVFSLTTLRVFLPLEMDRYIHIKAYLRRVGEREAYRRAMYKGDPNRVPRLA